MRSLFLKIFLCFWLSQIFIAGTTLGVSLVYPKPQAPWLSGASGPVRQLVRRQRAVARSNQPLPLLRLAYRLALVSIVSALISYFLARYLTAPTTILRRAAHRLASGDLAARVGPQMGRRRDELTDLGRDFDLMAARIEDLIRAQRHLLADISHELRSPLARLNVAVDLAMLDADDSMRAFLGRIERESGRLNALVGQLLTLSKLESGAAETPGEAVDLAKLVAEIVADANFEAHGQNRGVSLIWSQPCHVTGHANLLHSAIENVTRNALRFTPEGTEVEIELHTVRRNGGDAACVAVRDFGPGVPPEALDQLFRPFYRVEDARERSSGGVGLGLSIASRAAQFHGGEITAANAPSGGLVVEIFLPLAASI